MGGLRATLAAVQVRLFRLIFSYSWLMNVEAFALSSSMSSSSSLASSLLCPHFPVLVVTCESFSSPFPTVLTLVSRLPATFSLSLVHGRVVLVGSPFKYVSFFHLISWKCPLTMFKTNFSLALTKLIRLCLAKKNVRHENVFILHLQDPAIEQKINNERYEINKLQTSKP